MLADCALYFYRDLVLAMLVLVSGLYAFCLVTVTSCAIGCSPWRVRGGGPTAMYHSQMHGAILAGDMSLAPKGPKPPNQAELRRAHRQH